MSPLIARSPFFVLGITIGAILIGYLWSLHSLSVPLVYDANSYHQIAEEMQARGLFTKHAYSDLRTYGYPAFVRGVIGLSSWLGVGERVLAFLLQMGAHLAAAAGLFWALDRADVRRWAVRATVAAVAMHPLSLLFPGYLLTESLSLSMGTLVLAVAVLAWVRPLSAVGWLAGGILCGAMIMVRPASIFVVPVWGLVLLRGWRRRERMALLGVAGILLPMGPQLWMNLRYFNQATPLVTAPFGQALQTWGILHSKVTTSLIPNTNPRVTYENPFLVDEALARQDPLLWYRTYPAAGAGTVLLHLFNVLDQDLPLPYQYDLAPPHVPYTSGLNWSVVAVGLLTWGVAWRRRGEWTAGEQGAWWVSTGLMAGPLAICGVIIVEARYGLPPLVPLFAWALVGVAGLWRAGSSRQRWGVMAFAATAGLAGATLSGWVREYSPAIQDARNQVPRLPAGRTPRPALCEGPWTRWQLTKGHTGFGGVLVLQPGGAAEHPLTMEAAAKYWLDFEVLGKAVERTPFEIAIEAGGPAFERVRFVLSGEPGARLRFLGVGVEPVRVRNVRFGRANAMPPVADWRSEDVVVTFEGAAILCAHSGAVAQLAQTVDLERNTDYDVEFELRSEGPPSAPLSVDLFAGAAYDFAEQNRFVHKFGPAFERHVIRLNSGPFAPPRAELRFVTLNESPLEVRNIRFGRSH